MGGKTDYVPRIEFLENRFFPRWEAMSVFCGAWGGGEERFFPRFDCLEGDNDVSFFGAGWGRGEERCFPRFECLDGGTMSVIFCWGGVGWRGRAIFFHCLNVWRGKRSAFDLGGIGWEGRAMFFPRFERLV